MAKRTTKLSDQLRREIKQSDMTRYRISKMTGIDQAMLSRFVHGECGMSIDSLDKLAAVLDLRLTSGASGRGKKGR